MKKIIYLLSFLIVGCASVKEIIQNDVKVQLVRNATVKLTVNNKTILIDPILGAKGENDPIPFSNKIRNPTANLPTSVEDIIKNIDAVLLTHNHPDHLDSTAINALPKHITFFCQPSDLESLQNQGFENLIPINSEFNWEGVIISRYGASHHIGATGEPPFGESSSFSVKFNDNSIFITGDAILDEKLTASLKKSSPSWIIANTGECQFTKENPVLQPGQLMTLSKEELKQISLLMPEAKIIAVHLESINHCSLTREEIKLFLKSNDLINKILVPNDNDIIRLN
ncbi:MBL fold metallo-hydrolase [Flavivirga sp. 57AJ16]|uniref:MBL fold metallo-hydrolase n=1 Tax=Flavivirga sp. 57AJ16 TaxID=3025307 RepID=UPI002367170D|nr:MBL fold metallo-hydrolase [Flavivirga sp. 57AJ16]MDD7886216.1 MBL fold metallo-hydrolase [Flavivirga sp. 57AJ16]